MTKIIGLTGGIGSGKTTVANYIKSKGIPVYIADDEAKRIMHSAEIIQSIKNEFGIVVFDNAVLNREKLAHIVFNNPEKLKVLNQIIHPAVKKHFDNWLKDHQEFPYVVKEAAILFESGSYMDCDKIITVSTPLETRIKRVLERDSTTREAVLNRIQNQWTDAQRIAKSDYVIYNNTVNEAKEQVENILKLLNNQ
jgi:dephospho-CoA kinase